MPKCNCRISFGVFHFYVQRKSFSKNNFEKEKKKIRDGHFFALSSHKRSVNRKVLQNKLGKLKVPQVMN